MAFFENRTARFGVRAISVGLVLGACSGPRSGDDDDDDGGEIPIFVDYGDGTTATYTIHSRATVCR